MALPALLLTVLAILVLFRETALDMVDVWVHSGTYAHGMIVLPISLWLIWRMRDRVALLTPKHSYLAVLALAAAGAAWLLGELATVKVIPQFALVCMLIWAVVAVLGWQVARVLVFPLLYLLFAVPFGDFTQPKLMEWTAKFTVLGLRLTGIPVYSEGQNLVIPSGSWSVVEACSGVRYLIASVTVGTLFAYLTYRSLRRRLIFVGFSIVVPIVANWGRAYMIVMLGHLSGNKLAVGVDHLIYGWVFFGIVIMAMFWIGAIWREDELPPAKSQPLSPSRAAVGADSAVWVAAAATVLVATVWPLALWQLEHDTAPPVSQLAPLGPIAGWQTAQPGLLDWRPRFENYAASTQATFENGDRVAGLFIGYYRNQDQQHKMVTSMNALVSTEDPLWAKVGSGTRQIEVNQQRTDVRTTVLRGPVSARLLVWQWYWVDGRWTASDFLAKAYTALARLRGRGDDSAVIILYALPTRTEQADTILEDFARAAMPAIENTLQQTREAR
jgi:exosortase A